MLYQKFYKEIRNGVHLFWAFEVLDVDEMKGLEVRERVVCACGDKLGEGAQVWQGAELKTKE
jgi:hypothetical protein